MIRAGQPISGPLSAGYRAATRRAESSASHAGALQPGPDAFPITGEGHDDVRPRPAEARGSGHAAG